MSVCSAQSRSWTGVVALFAYVVLTLMMTWPLPAHLTSRLAGDDVDVLINPWADWWTHKALTEGHSLYYTDYLFYPHGVSLVFHSFSHTHTAVSLLLAPLVGAFAAYNLAILLAYILSGFGTYCLVRYLTNCAPAAFLAGAVFAFHPYHLFQSSHPVLVTTQFMPLFVLALTRIRRDTTLGTGGRIRQTALAALWFLLNALSSWHLMLMLAGWTGLYLLYYRTLGRTESDAGTLRYVVLALLVCALVVTPFLIPLLQEQLTDDASYMAVDVTEGRGNDLLSFFVPHRLHPVFGPAVLELNARIGYTRNSPAYLGYIALGLAVISILTARRQSRFWWIALPTFAMLSLGSRLNWIGEALHTFYLPWAVPITAVLRHPLRLNTLLFLTLAVLAGFGARWVFERTAVRSRRVAYSVLTLAASVLLFEYWAFPFPTTQPTYSPFLDQLAAEEGDFAIADFPIDRQADKYYMFYQTVHHKKITGGVVSRTPYGASSFIDTDPLLSAIRNENVPDEYISERMAVLAAKNIRYILIHKPFLDAERMHNWQKWLAHFPTPFYEDNRLIVYRTTPDLKTDLLNSPHVLPLDARLGDHVHLRGYRLSAAELSVGDTLTVTLFWQSERRMAQDYHVFVHLLDAEGRLAAQHDGTPVHGERPTWSWWGGEVIQDEHILNTGLDMPTGVYTLSVGMYDLSTALRLPVVGPAGERSPDDRVVLDEVRVVSP